MSQGTFAGLLTLGLFIAFVGGVFWAYSSKRKAEFDAAARLPLEEAEPQSQPSDNRNRENAP